MLRQRTLWFIVCLIAASCTLQDPCREDEYLEDSTQTCRKQTDKNCGLLGNIDCNDPSAYDQTNVRSWSCEHNTCLVNDCMANASPTDNKLACVCNALFYYDRKLNQCVKLSGEACGEHGEINCYEKNSSELVTSWGCDSEHHDAPTCMVNTCIPNAEADSSRQNCRCKENYYYDTEQKQCIKLSGEACGAQGEIDCYNKYSTPTVTKWRCETTVENAPACLIESCVPNSELKQEEKTCECFPGYYFNDELHACMKRDAEHCGNDGRIDCYHQDGNMSDSVKYWECAKNDSNDYVCKVVECLPYAHLSESELTCECNDGFELVTDETNQYCRPKCIDDTEVCHINQYCHSVKGCMVLSCKERCGDKCFKNECVEESIGFIEPKLCEEEPVYNFLKSYLVEFMDAVGEYYDYKISPEFDGDVIANDCRLYYRIEEIFDKEDINEWCSSIRECGSPSLVSRCVTSITKIIANDILDDGKERDYDISDIARICRFYQDLDIDACYNYK